MHRVGEHPVPAGPLAVRWLGWELVQTPRAGTVGRFDLVLENAGSVAWRQIAIGYHWLDDLGNPMIWGELWTPIEQAVDPGATLEQRVEVRAPLRIGDQRLAFDLVDDGRFWFSQVGNTQLELNVDVPPRIERALAVTLAPGPADLAARTNEALEAQDEGLVERGHEAALAHLAPGCLPAPDWSRRVLDAHQEGYAVVAGSVEPLGWRKPRSLAPWAPGTGRVPHFSQPLLCPSLVNDAEPPNWLDDVQGLPALAPPQHEPWLYDGRIAIRARLPSGRRRA